VIISGKAEPVTCVAILHSYSERMNAYIQKEQCRYDAHTRRDNSWYSEETPMYRELCKSIFWGEAID
jgi:hypothetical protein